MKKIDPTKHILVPKHVKVSEKEKEEVLKTYHITQKELPKIFVKDAAIAHLKLKEGDVVKIQRASPTAGDTVYYRSVINA